MVSLSFLIETAFVVGLGVISGRRSGSILARNLFTSDDEGAAGAAFLIPWPIISIVLVGDGRGGAADGLDPVPPGGQDCAGGGAAVRVGLGVSEW